MALTERLAILIEASAGSAVAEFKKVGAAAKGAQSDVAGSTKSLGGLGQAGSVAGNLLKAGMVTAAAGAGAAIAKFVVGGVNDFVNLAGEVKRFKAVAGGTAESASLLVAAFKSVGIDADTAAGSVFQLEKRLTTNATALSGFGIQVTKDAKGNTDMAQTLLSVGDAYKRTQDPVQRATLLAAAFGKTGTALIPILGKSREQIQAFYDAAARHHEVFSQEDLDKATEFKLATHDLSEAFTGLGREVGSALIPALTGLAHVMTSAIEGVDHISDALNHAGDASQNFFDGLGQHAGPAKGIIQNIGKGIKENLNLSTIAGSFIPAAAAIDHAGSALGLFGDKASAAAKAEAVAAQESVDAIAVTATAANNLTKSLFSLEDAHHAVDTAVRAEATAHRELADKQKTLDDLIKKTAVDQKAVAQAHQDVTAAEVTLAKARREQTDATKAAHDAEVVLNDLRTGATAAKNAVDHADDVGKAQLGVTRASKRLGDAQDALTVLQNSGTATARQLSDAQDDVTQATYDLHDANADLITTQDNVNKLQQVGAENSPEVVAAVKTVEDAHQSLADHTQAVADAIQNVSDKQTALGLALAGDPNYADKVREARQAVADATQHVADAMYNVAQNKAKFEEARDVLTQTVGAGGPAAVDTVRTNIDELLKKKPELALFFDPVLADLHEASTLLNGDPTGGVLGAAPGTVLTGLTAGLGALSGHIPGHAAGGPISGLSIVGEKGPELFAGHGTIIPNNMLGGGGTTVINVAVQAGIVGDADKVADDIWAALSRLKRRNGDLGLN